MKTKTCSSCKEEKPIEDFIFKDKPKGRRNASCKICTRAQSKRYYEKNVQSHVDRARKHNKLKWERWREYKKTLSCTVCGESESCCLDFHHNDPDEKEFNMNRVHQVGWESLMKEVSKCTVLCANCHRKVHNGIIKLL